MDEEPSEVSGKQFEAVVNELKSVSVALEDTDTEPSVAEIEALTGLVGDATVVGLGEAGHGVREMYGYRARLCRILIEELGFRDIALEADFSATRAIDRYVNGSDDAVEDVLRTPGVHAIWQNEATAAFLKWARAFNENRSADDRIRFHGLDIIEGGPVGEALRAYLETVDPSLLDVVIDDLQLVIETPTPFGMGSELGGDDLAALADACDRLTETLRANFESNQQAYLEASSEPTLERAKREVTLIGALGEMADGYGEQPPTTAIESRNRTLADGVSWLLDSETADRVVFLAANLHVKRGTWREPLEDAKAAGEFIHQRLGDAYRRIGGSVATGHVRVYDDETGAPETAEISSPPTGSLPDALAATGYECSLVDLEAVAEMGATASWFADEPVLRELATRVEHEAATPFEIDPSAEFDALLFVKEATAAGDLGE